MASGGSNAGGAASAAGEAGEPDADPAPSLLGCPDQSWNQCPERFNLTLHFDGTSTKSDDARVWSEPLQLPAFPEGVSGPLSGPIDPALWDRSMLPAGACVFRIHGAPASCLVTNFGRVRSGPCGAPPPIVVPFGYYETSYCDEGIAPGCGNAEPYHSDNQAWYVVPEAEPDQFRLVMCAGICSVFVGGETGQMCVVGGPAQ